MAYPTNYQDAEHRRALNAILDDLQTITTEQQTDGAEHGSTIGEDSDDLVTLGTDPRPATSDRSDAEVQVQTTRLSTARMATQSAN